MRRGKRQKWVMFKSQVCLRKAFYTNVWRTYPAFPEDVEAERMKSERKRAARDTNVRAIS